MRYLIRFNKHRGKPGRGSSEHVWRVFEGTKEYIVKHVRIEVPCWDETTGEDGADNFNICCEGTLQLDRENSIAKIC